MQTDELKSFLEENADNEEIRTIISEYAPKPKLEELLSSEDYSSKFNSLIESEKTKAVNSFKEKTLPLRVQEEVEKKLQQREKKDPWQIKLEEMEKEQERLKKQLEDKERAEQRERLKNSAIKTIHSKELPDDLVDFLLGDDEETTNQNLNLFEEALSKYAQKQKSKIYNKSTDAPEESTGAAGEPGPNASKEDWKRYYSKKRR